MSDQYRYLKLSQPTSGEWPASQSLQPGAIIRLPITDPVPWGPAVFNEETKGWATAVWLEIADPSLQSADPSNGDDHE